MNPNFARNILFTEECSFSREGMYNTHNWHLWADENPNIIGVRGFQEKFSTNVWAGIIDDRLVILIKVFIVFFFVIMEFL
jgi:hypothetical protein